MDFGWFSRCAAMGNSKCGMRNCLPIRANEKLEMGNSELFARFAELFFQQQVKGNFWNLFEVCVGACKGNMFLDGMGGNPLVGIVSRSRSALNPRRGFSQRHGSLHKLVEERHREGRVTMGGAEKSSDTRFAQLGRRWFAGEPFSQLPSNPPKAGSSPTARPGSGPKRSGPSQAKVRVQPAREEAG